MRIGVISDTHVPVRARALPGQVFRIFAGVDLILHAGDLVTLDVLDELQAIAPVLAVHGNVDHPEVQERLPAVLRIEVGPSGVIKVESKGPAGGGPLARAGVRAEAESEAGYEAQAQAQAQAQAEPSPAVAIGLVHGHEGNGRTTAERAASNFPDASVVVFGHSQHPMNEWHDGRLLFNPGSATDPRRAASASVGIIEVTETVTALVVDLRDE